MNQIPLHQPEPEEEKQPAKKIGLIGQTAKIIAVSALLATMFTAWTPLGLFPVEWIDGSQEEAADEPEVLDEPVQSADTNSKIRVGIVSGHWDFDSGAICADGLTEMEVNQRISTIVKDYLTAEGYTVDLMKERDPRLEGYQASAFVSIHADSCIYINDFATGFKTAPAANGANDLEDYRLAACFHERYAEATGLNLHQGITPDMTDYHAFGRIDPLTTGVIVEVGFMNLDRQLLTENPEIIAQGVVNSIKCYLNNEPVAVPDLP